MKRISIILTVGILLTSSIKAQTPLMEDFLKTYKIADEGITQVNVSQEFLKQIFEARRDRFVYNRRLRSSFSLALGSLHTPEAFCSISINRGAAKKDGTDDDSNNVNQMFTNFCKALKKNKFSSCMELNKGTNLNVAIFQKVESDSCREVYRIRQDARLTIVYLKGNLEIQDLEQYYSVIRNYLAQYSDIDFRLGNDCQDISFANLGLDVEQWSQAIQDWAEREDIQGKMEQFGEEVQKRMEEFQPLIEENLRKLEEKLNRIPKDTADMKDTEEL